MEGLLELEAMGENVRWPEGPTREHIAEELRERSLRKRASHGSGSAPAQLITSILVAAAVVPETGIGVQAPIRRADTCRVDRSSIGHGHMLYVSGAVVFCGACGYWTSSNVRRDGLGGPCKPLKKTNEARLRRMMKAEHPLTQQPMPQPRRLR